MKRLLPDQGIPRTTAAILKSRGWDAVHVADLGMSRFSDSQIIEAARAGERVCVTLDADFHALVALTGELQPSVIRVRREGLNGRSLAALLESIWPRIEGELAGGAFVTVGVHNVRIRRLPILRGDE